MHLWVFLCVNSFRLRSRRIGDIRCLKTWEMYRLHTLMIFDDRTHPKRRPRHYTLDFYTKLQVWRRMVRIPKVLCTKMIMTMLALSCYKKRERIMIKKQTKCLPTSLTHACLNWIYLDHAKSCFMLFILYTLVWVYLINTPIGFLN